MLRRTPLTRRTPLLSKTPLRSRVLLVRQQLAATWQKRRSNTGPDRATRLLVWDRCGGYCEWPGCLSAAVDIHHRLNRKAGGRKGAMRDLLNSPPWLLGCCRFHHELVTNPVGAVREQAEDWGWLLREGQHAALVPVRTRHSAGWLYLTADGGTAV